MTLPAQLTLVLALSSQAATPAPALSKAIRAVPDIPRHPVIQSEYVALSNGQHRAFFARGLARRAQWADLVDHALESAALPSWLAAVPLVESSYANWGAPGAAEPQRTAPGTVLGRGLWMFIPQTARQYGLRVDEQVDERLDPELETAAAMALLTDLHDEFGDWGLALAAYNQGARAVRKAIHSSDSRSVLRLIELGALSPYAARVMAAALLMESTQ